MWSSELWRLKDRLNNETSFKLDKINPYSLKGIEILETWIMVFEPIELLNLNKMCLVIDDSTIYYLASPVTGCSKLVSLCQECNTTLSF